MSIKIKKRDRRIVDFDQEKITNAIFKSAQEVGGRDRSVAEELTKQVVRDVKEKHTDGSNPTVEEVQDIVEKVLIENGRAKTAKAYILYRQKRSEARRVKAALGVVDEVKLPTNALNILAARYLKKDERGRVVESTSQMFRRVSEGIAWVEMEYGKSEMEVKALEQDFYDMLVNLEFLPNSPTLMNAGVKEKLSLSACFVIPINDSIEGVFDALKIMAKVQKSGGGTGFSFSRLRPSGDIVKSTTGTASGPISFMKIFDAATEQIKQGGKRRGANMGMMKVNHPDILDFIVCKEMEGTMRNFNISVAVTDAFMKAVKSDEDFNLVNPRNGEVVKKLKARAIWNLLITLAWKNGEPGIVFIDKINQHCNSTPLLGEIESTNPCGEQPLLPYESCNLGSINLSKMVKKVDAKYEVNWEKLMKTVKKAVRFLDNVIDANVYPVDQIEEMTKGNRKIGLGVMGFADMLILLRMSYNSPQAFKIAEKVMKFITDEARKTSVTLGEDKGNFPNFKGSRWDKLKYKNMRNAALTTIAPTGSISEIASCSQGIEPMYSVGYVRGISESLGTNLVVINSYFQQTAIKNGFYNDSIMQKVMSSTSVQGISEIPKNIRKIFITAHDLKPEDHVKMQATFQKHVDNAISKTVNFSNEATPHDVEKVFMLAYDRGCLGITVYRHESRKVQVLKTVAGAIGKCEVCEL